MKVRWALRLTCLSAVTVVIAACGTSTHPTAGVPPSPSATPAATEVVAYSPYVNDHPRPGLAVSAPVSVPSCSASQNDLEPLRCIPPAGTIYDPCFPDSAGASCLYVTSPTATTASKVLLGPPSGPQPATARPDVSRWPGYSPAVPWAIELSDGTMCVFSHGAEDNVNGLRPEDGCPDGRFLFGDATESTGLWTVQVGASQSGPLIGTTTIKRVWIFAATGPLDTRVPSAPLAAGQIGTRAQVPWSQVGAGWFVVTSNTSADPGTETLWLISPLGGRYRIVSWPAVQQPTGGAIGSEIPIAWSGDGRRVLMSGDSSKHEIRLDTGAIRSVGVDTVGYTAPSGTQFVALHEADSQQSMSLERVDASGAVQLVLTTLPDRTNNRWLYSPDGATIYATGTAGVTEINNATAVAKTLLVQRDANVCDPVRWWAQGVILTMCENDAGFRLWLLPIDGSQPRQITANPGTGGVWAGLGEVDAVTWKTQLYAQGLRGCGVVGIDRVSSDTHVTAVTVPGSLDNDILVGAAPSGLAVLSTGECNLGGWFGFFNPTSGVVTTIIGTDSPDGSAVYGLEFGSTSWFA